MTSVPSDTIELSRAIAAACRLARTEAEMLERCRVALVQHVGDERLWLTANTALCGAPTPPAPAASELLRFRAGGAEVALQADLALHGILAPRLAELHQALAVGFELRQVLLDRQGALDDALYQLRALRQATRLLDALHSQADTETQVLEFFTEVFFAEWSCLYRAERSEYVAREVRRRGTGHLPAPIPRDPLDALVPVGRGPVPGDRPELVAITGLRPRLVVPLDAADERQALLLLGGRAPDLHTDAAEATLAGTLASTAAVALKNARLVAELQSDATTDELTGLLNRRALEDRLHTEISRTVRHQTRTSVVMLDLDHFKRVNDTLGHAAGDRMLVLVANALRAQSRALDMPGRLGGDEFVVVMPMTGAEDANHFVRRVRAAMQDIERTNPEFEDCTACMGIAEAPRHGTTVAAIMAAADRALYTAKRAGRAAVAVAEG